MKKTGKLLSLMLAVLMLWFSLPTQYRYRE